MRRDRGLSLIELLAAMAILAVVATMGVQMIANGLAQRRVLTQIDERAGALAVTLALLRQDLESAVPVVASAGQPAVAVARDAIAWQRGGLLDDTGAPSPGSAPVRWALNGDTLTRQLGDGPAVAMLTEVRSIDLRGLGGALPRVGEPVALSPGFEAVIDHARLGALSVVVAR